MVIGGGGEGGGGEGMKRRRRREGARRLWVLALARDLRGGRGDGGAVHGVDVDEARL